MKTYITKVNELETLCSKLTTNTPIVVKGTQTIYRNSEKTVTKLLRKIK